MLGSNIQWSFVQPNGWIGNTIGVFVQEKPVKVCKTFNLLVQSGLKLVLNLNQFVHLFIESRNWFGKPFKPCPPFDFRCPPIWFSVF